MKIERGECQNGHFLIRFVWNAPITTSDHPLHIVVVLHVDFTRYLVDTYRGVTTFKNVGRSA